MTDRCEPPPELRGVDGWHWVRSIGNIGSELLFWGGRYGRWQNDAGDEVYLADGRWFYTSPVATPAEVEALRAERDALAKQVTIPGVWRCAKCEFRLVQSNLNAADGTVTARDTPGDKCPNCAAPLWRVTYKNDNAEAIQLAERFCQEAFTLRARVAELEGALRGIARQHLVAEMQADDVANADWHFANDVIVGIARAALSPATEAAQGEP